MGIIQIEPVTRTGMRFIISLFGLSETGKTLSALKLAAGLEPDPKKRGLLDTEGGQRGRAFADHIPGGYMYGRLTPPFTPERYIEAIDDFESAGTGVLTIDSVSHAWFAEGGVLDMVEVATDTNKMARWIKPKRRLGKMTRRILSSDMHVILCSRGKQPMVEVSGGKYELGPVVPVQEKSLRFDMTIMAQMLGDGRFTVTAPAGKCPGALRPIFAAAGDGGVMDEAMGRKLAEWIKGNDMKTPFQRQAEIAASLVADEGAFAFRTFWKDSTPAMREYLRPNLPNYESMARAADADKLARKEAGDDSRREAVGSPFTIRQLGEKSGEILDRQTEDAGDGILADEAAQEAETALERGLRLLATRETAKAIDELAETISEELPEEDRLAWSNACAAREQVVSGKKGKIQL